MTTDPDDLTFLWKQYYPPQPSERLWSLSSRLHVLSGQSSTRTMDVLTQLESIRIALIESYNFPRTAVDFLRLIEQALDDIGIPAPPEQ